MADILNFPLPETLAETHTEPTGATPPSDAAARSDALDTSSSCIVEAPAGSGKTGLLVQRFLKLLADHDTGQPEEVLAMTFTRKATAEMQQRVLEHLQNAHARVPLRGDANPFDRETRALAEAVLARDSQLGWNILAQPQRLNIRSILSVCLEIADSLPLLSGSAPREPLEDARPLYRLAARRTLLQLGGADPALHNALRTILLHRDGSLSDVETLLADMLDSRDQWGELIPLDSTSLSDPALDLTARPKLERILESIVCAGLTRALHTIPAQLLEQMTSLAAHIGGMPQWKQREPLLSICSDKHLPPEAKAEHLDHWLALTDMLLTKEGCWRKSVDRGSLGHDFGLKRDKPRLQQLIGDLNDQPASDDICEALHAVRNLPPARYPDEQWAVARALFHVLRHALIELKLLFSERNQYDYTELALAAREALRSSTETDDSGPDSHYTLPDLALAAGGRLRHLLVDEMQDTSATQYELIKLLTASWDGHSQTLFLVGDPKQSIYLFRQATVARFLRTLAQARLGDIPLTPLRLTANFRSQATLVHAFNHTFGGDHPAGRIFPPPVDSSDQNSTHAADDVPFVAATPTRRPTEPHAIDWHTSVLGEEPHTLPLTDADSAAAEARHIRRLIEQRLATPLPPDRSFDKSGNPKPWRIAVLARARNHLAAVVQELKAHGDLPAIPFRAVDLDSLDQLPEVLDALALTRALLHPADRIAWLAVLHAPWCGLGLADLLALTGEASLESPATPDVSPHATIATVVRTRRQHLSPLGQQLLRRVWPILETATSTLGRTPLSVHVERTWRSLGGDAPLTPEQQSNVLRFLSVLRELEAEPSLTSLDLLSALTARLKVLYAEPLPGDQTQAQVELLTIHKAKGLEWDIVFLPGLHRRTHANSSGLLNWIELDDPAHGTSSDTSPDTSSDHEATILLAPIWGKGSDSDQLNQWLRNLRSARERAEEKRLFYVAATRAREQLHLFAALSRKQDGSLAAPAHGTLLKACWPAAEPEFAALAAHPEPLVTESTSPLNGDLLDSLEDDLLDSFNQGLALAASAANDSESPSGPANSAAPPQTVTSATVQRLPLSFDPSARFAAADHRRLPYAQADTLSPAPAFDRPEGSFAVRAFGNVVHRYLQVLAARLADSTPEAILSELPDWEPRLTASLRGEGLPPAAAAREATRALRALTLTLNDPTGRWILAPHPLAASEQSLTLPSFHSLRIDRTFLAGPSPLSTGAPAEPAHLWIIDFKTTEPGSRSPDAFAASEIAKYAAQLEAYASLRRSLPGTDLPIRLGLFYPLIPRLLHWPFSPIPHPTSPASRALPQPLPQEAPTPASSPSGDILG